MSFSLFNDLKFCLESNKFFLHLCVVLCCSAGIFAFADRAYFHLGAFADGVRSRANLNANVD